MFLLSFSILSIQPSNGMLNIFLNYSDNSDISLKTTQTNIYKIDLQVTAPSGYTLSGNTPIIIKLTTLADEFPVSVDVFGLDTPDPSDDLKWSAVYITYDEEIIPSQVDDIDSQVGYSEDDELLFQLPESLELTSGESASFSIFLGTLETNLPDPIFPEACTVYDYTKYTQVREYFGADMLKKAYYIENSKIQAAALVDAAWSSGGIYELSVLGEEGNSRWDAIKQRFDPSWEAWKWARFATVEQFIELNDKAGTNNFFIPNPERSIIQGPVRARIQMQSIPPYGKASSVWGTIPGVYGLVTYELFANLPYLDYTLATTGPNAAANPNLIIELQNREKAPGGQYSPYKSVYVPGDGWRPRNPDDLLVHKILPSDFSESWYLEKLAPGEIMSPYEENSDKLGFGCIFDMNGLTNITYQKASEDMKLMYDPCELPLNARYFPFDVTITQDAITYMEDNFQEWSRPDPDLDISVSVVTALPFEYVGVSRPHVSFNNDTALLQIENITAMSTEYGIINDTIESTRTYKVLVAKSKEETGIEGDLSWNSTTLTWEAHDVSLASLSRDIAYVVVAYFQVGDILGISPYSKSFPEIPDTTAPLISNIIQSPPAEAIILSADSVNVSAMVTDDTKVESVILSYNNGTAIWTNITMTYGFGVYTATIPPQAEGSTIQYQIYAYDSAGNANVSETFSYEVSIEYHPGQGIIPFLGASAILIGAVIIALKTTSMHRQKYDEVE